MMRGSGSRWQALGLVAALAFVGLTGGCSGMIKDKVRANTNAVWNERKLDLIDKGYAADLAKLTRDFAEKTFAEYPDFKIQLGEIALDGDYLFMRWTATGTSKTYGKQTTIRGITYSRLDGRKVVEQQMVWNELDAAKQLGFKVVTPQGETKEIVLTVP